MGVVRSPGMIEPPMVEEPRPTELLENVASAVRAAQADDPMRAVVVVAPSSYAALAWRRELPARGTPLFNVELVTFSRLAERLARPLMRSARPRRRPSTPALRSEAVRLALEAQPGSFGVVAGHPSTQQSVQRACRDVRTLGPSERAGLSSQGRRAADVVRVAGAGLHRLGGAWYDDHDVMLAAHEAHGAPERLGSGAGAGRVPSGLPAGLDAVVVGVALPAMLTSDERLLLHVLGRCPGVTIVTAPPRPEPRADHLVSAADPDEEVRAAIRLALKRVHGGSALSRLAILYPATDPYASIVTDQLAAAGLVWHGPAHRSVAGSMAGGTVLAALALVDAEFRRDAVLEWISAGPILDDSSGLPVPAAAWERVSRAAGVIGGLDGWAAPLAHWAARQRREHDRLEPGRDDDTGRDGEREGRRRRRLLDDAATAEQLAAFVDRLIAALDPGAATTWPELSDWAARLLGRFLGGTAQRSSWPERELMAYDTVVERLGELAELGALADVSEGGPVGAHTDLAGFRRALADELARVAIADGRFGVGLFVGPLASAIGLGFETAIVLGLAEGSLPTVEPDDATLPNRERATVRMARWGPGVDEQRDMLGALAAATGEVILVSPRADPRRGRVRMPSRLVLEAASTHGGRRLSSDDWLGVGDVAWLTVIPSFEGGLAGAVEPVSTAERRLQMLLLASRRRTPIDTHPLVVDDDRLRVGLAIRRSRGRGRFDRFEGAVGPLGDSSPSAGQPISPTSLEHYATCPRRFFFDKQLGVAALDRPERILELSPLHQGSLVHEVLERFVKAAPPPASPSHDWTIADRHTLRLIAGEVCADYERRGLTGKPLLWEVTRRRLVRDLDAFLAEDRRLRERLGVVPDPGSVEVAFGLDGGDPAVELTLADGTPIRFRGRIDRIDRSPDGRHLVVIDYKTGSAKAYVTPRAAIARGARLQLPIYALAAQQRHGELPVTAVYFFVSRRAQFAQRLVTVDGEVVAELGQAVGTIVDGITQGRFPARPGASGRDGSHEHCQWCDYDMVCSTSRLAIWEQVRTSPELEPYVRLVEGPPLARQLALDAWDTATDGDVGARGDGGAATGSTPVGSARVGSAPVGSAPVGSTPGPAT